MGSNGDFMGSYGDLMGSNGDLMGSNGDFMGSYGDLTMETNITMEHHHFSMGKSLCMAIFKFARG